MSLFRRLEDWARTGHCIQVAVVGAGLMGRGLLRQLRLTAGMRPALVVNRTPERACRALVGIGVEADSILVSDEPEALRAAVAEGRPAVTTQAGLLAEIPDLDVMIEATGAVEHGARAALHAIDGGVHVVMLNAETDATVGCALKTRADRAGVVYTNADGDQPGVLMRMIDYVGGMGFEIVAAVNCKGFLNPHATPDDVRPWAERQRTSLPMTTAFTDGTKMNIENAVLANATGLVPDVRGMHGVRTELSTALQDCLAAVDRDGVVEYTLGGDFGGGVFVIGRAGEPQLVKPYMSYFKMGEGPCYLFFRPYHLCHLETPLTVIEAVLDHVPTIAPTGAPVAEVVTLAKRDLRAGERLDGIGGYTCYGEIDTAHEARGLLPIGLATDAVLSRDIRCDEPIAEEAVEMDRDSLLCQLRREHLTVRSLAA